MKLKIALLTMMVFIVGLLILRNKSTKKNLDSVVSQKAQPPSSRLEKSRAIRRKIVNSKIEVKFPPAEDAHCEELWLQVENYPFNELNPPPPPMNPLCQKLPEFLRAAHQLYLQSCGSILTTAASPAPVQKDALENCKSHLFFYRAALHDWATPNVNIKTSEDRVLLINKLLSSFVRQDFHVMEQAALRLRELEPDFYEPLQALVAAKLFESAVEKDERKVTELGMELEHAVQDARAFGISDPQLVNAEVMYKTKFMSDTPSLERAANEMTAEYPQLGMGDYLRAHLKFREKDYEGTKRYLESALAKEPSNQNFKDSLAKLTQNPTDFSRSIFTIGFGVSFEVSDLNEPGFKKTKP